MHDRERRDEIGIGEVWVELLDLRREKKPLVDDRPRRAGADVGRLRRLLDLPADDVEAMLVGAINEHLPYSRHYFSRVVSDGIGIGRHVAPRKNLATFALHRRLYLLLFALSAEDHGNAEESW